MPRCPMCNGPGIMLGILGMLRWFTCRDCGWEFRRKVRRRDRKKPR